MVAADDAHFFRRDFEVASRKFHNAAVGSIVLRLFFGQNLEVCGREYFNPFPFCPCSNPYTHLHTQTIIEIGQNCYTDGI